MNFYFLNEQEILLKIVLFLISVLCLKLLQKILSYSTQKTFVLKNKINNKTRSKRKKQKEQTILKTINIFYRYIFTFFICISFLYFCGVNISTLIAGTGFLALVITFAIQDLLKDVTSGLFILFEDYYFVGDYIKTNDIEGTVLEVGIRTTFLELPTGETGIVTNRDMLKVINYSEIKKVAYLDFPIPYEKYNISEAKKILNQELNKKLNFKTQIIGFFNPTDFSVTIRIKFDYNDKNLFENKLKIRNAIIEILKF